MAPQRFLNRLIWAQFRHENEVLASRRVECSSPATRTSRKERQGPTPVPPSERCEASQPHRGRTHRFGGSSFGPLDLASFLRQDSVRARWASRSTEAAKSGAFSARVRQPRSLGGAAAARLWSCGAGLGHQADRSTPSQRVVVLQPTLFDHHIVRLGRCGHRLGIRQRRNTAAARVWAEAVMVWWAAEHRSCRANSGDQFLVATMRGAGGGR